MKSITYILAVSKPAVWPLDSYLLVYMPLQASKWRSEGPCLDSENISMSDFQESNSKNLLASSLSGKVDNRFAQMQAGSARRRGENL